MAYVANSFANQHMDHEKWEKAPEDFTYPWGWFWTNEGSSQNWIKRPSRGRGYVVRRLTKFERTMLDRITSNKKFKLEELGYHPDQLILF